MPSTKPLFVGLELTSAVPLRLTTSGLLLLSSPLILAERLLRFLGRRLTCLPPRDSSPESEVVGLPELSELLVGALRTLFCFRSLQRQARRSSRRHLSTFRSCRSLRPRNRMQRAAVLLALALISASFEPRSDVCFDCGGGRGALSVARGRRHCPRGSSSVLPINRAPYPAPGLCPGGCIAPMRLQISSSKVSTRPMLAPSSFPFAATQQGVVIFGLRAHDSAPRDRAPATGAPEIRWDLSLPLSQELVLGS